MTEAKKPRAGTALAYVYDNCPKLAKRINEDAAEGIFHFDWAVPGKATNEYLESLVNWKIPGHERRDRVLDEIERRL